MDKDNKARVNEMLDGLCARVLAMRKKSGLLQSEASFLAGVSQAGLCNIEKGRAPLIRADVAIKLARLFDVSIDYLLTGEEYDGEHFYGE